MFCVLYRTNSDRSEKVSLGKRYFENLIHAYCNVDSVQSQMQNSKDGGSKEGDASDWAMSAPFQTDLCPPTSPTLIRSFTPVLISCVLKCVAQILNSSTHRYQ